MNRYRRAYHAPAAYTTPIVSMNRQQASGNPTPTAICARPANPTRRVLPGFVQVPILPPARHRTKGDIADPTLCNMRRLLKSFAAKSAHSGYILNNADAKQGGRLAFVDWSMPGCIPVSDLVTVAGWVLPEIMPCRASVGTKASLFPFVPRARKKPAALLTCKLLAVCPFRNFARVTTQQHAVVSGLELASAVPTCFCNHGNTISGTSEGVKRQFAGSCTTGRAAKDLRRRCVCVEREEKYCEIAALRMRQEVLPL